MGRRPGATLEKPVVSDPLARRIGIALGSNLGDRLAHLRAARELLLLIHFPLAPFLCSRVYETQPIDCPAGSLPFLNAAIELSSSLPPLAILQHIHDIEHQLGRPPVHAYHAPRTIDLDILYCDDLPVSLDTLILPHPRISERLFVLKPLADICPNRIIDCRNRMVCELRESLESLQKNSGVELYLTHF